MRPAESFIGQPVRSLQTMLRVLHIDNNGYTAVIPDGIYGNNTINAVATFQRQNGIPITGVTDQRTWDAIVSAYDEAITRVAQADYIEILLNPQQVLRFGNNNPHIYLLQSMLTFLSEVYEPISRPTHTGILDAQTTTAIESFQRLAGLPINGNVDLTTWKHISRHYTSAAHKHSKEIVNNL